MKGPNDGLQDHPNSIRPREHFVNFNVTLVRLKEVFDTGTNETPFVVVLRGLFDLFNLRSPLSRGSHFEPEDVKVERLNL